MENKIKELEEKIQDQKELIAILFDCCEKLVKLESENFDRYCKAQLVVNKLKQIWPKEKGNCPM